MLSMKYGSLMPEVVGALLSEGTKKFTYFNKHIII